MANELPYFRFIVSAWQNGKIILEDYSTQGVFINVCGYYWIQDCSITMGMLEKRFRDAKSEISALVLAEIIKHDKKTDFIEIDFLNEQFDKLSQSRKNRQNAGREGGYAKAKKQNPSIATTLPEQNDSNALDIRINKDKDKEEKLPAKKAGTPNLQKGFY